MVSYTSKLRIPKANFDQSPWHQDFWSALDQIDSIVYNSLVAANVQVWANNTVYPPGRGAIDPSGMIFVNTTQHTSGAGPLTFSQERIANPTFWIALVSGFVVKGAWQHDTAYLIGDILYDTSQGIVGLCTNPHTSNHAGTIRTDAANWAFIVDFTTIATAGGMSFTPTGNIAATNVQAALVELDTEKLAAANNLSELASPSAARGNLGLATVASTGAYSDLLGKPTLGTAATLNVGTGANNVVQLNGSSQLPGVDGSLLTGIAGFPAGTNMLFQQTAAPTGWTKQVTHNDKALRVVSGTASSGGTNAFSTVMAQSAVGNTTLAGATVPSHNHGIAKNGLGCVFTNAMALPQSGTGSITFDATLSDTSGSGGAHNHAITMDIKFVDLIIASKN